MVTLPLWLLIILLILVVAATMWITMHVVMWATGRLVAEDRGGSKDEYPWNWRVLGGAGAYFGWLEKHLHG